MQHLSLVKANESDIPTIAALAHRIWNQHYPAIIGQKQVDYMLEKMYSTESLEEQMIRNKHLFFLIEVAGKSTGFISVTDMEKGEWFLNKFYIDQEKASKGLGSTAYKVLLEQIKPSKVTLTVNRQNFKAINFYFKNGFQIERLADFDIGEGYVMNDFVMVHRIGSHP